MEVIFVEDIAGGYQSVEFYIEGVKHTVIPRYNETPQQAYERKLKEIKDKE